MTKLNVVGASIKPKLTIWAPLGAVTQKRRVPEVEIEPLNVVPAGTAMCSCDNEETEKVGTVVADAENTIKGSVISIVNTVHVRISVFFIFPT